MTEPGRYGRDKDRQIVEGQKTGREEKDKRQADSRGTKDRQREEGQKTSREEKDKDR